jgi:hypothetical protein
MKKKATKRRASNPDQKALSDAYKRVSEAESRYVSSFRVDPHSSQTTKLKEAYKAAADKFRALRRPNPEKVSKQLRGLETRLKAKLSKALAKFRGKKRNPELERGDVHAAAKMFKRFTGRKAKRVDVLEMRHSVPTALADCGRLVELVVFRPGSRDTLTFAESGNRVVRVGCAPNGGQLYFVGGDQEVSLSGLGAAASAKAQVDLGEVVRIVYYTSKAFHNFEPVEYSHKFGEVLNGSGQRVMADDAKRPVLGYDTEAKLLYLVGGSYMVKPAGIIK